MTVYVLPAAEQSGPIPIAYPDCAGDVVVNRFEIDLGSAPLKGVTLAQDDILDIGIIPATSQVVDVIIDSDDLDSNGSPTVAFDVGVLTGTPGTTGNDRVCGSEFFAASTVAQAGGVARATAKTAFRVARADTDKSVGVKITAAAATQATSGKIGVSVFVKG